MGWHGMIDLVGQVDEAGLVAVELHLPGEVAWIDWDTVPADSRTRVKWQEPKRLGAGRLDHLAGANPQAPTHERELVRQRDVDVPEDVFVQLGQLSHLWARHFDDLVNDLPVKEPREACARRGHAADNLRNVFELVDAVPGIDPLRREGEKDVLAHQGSPRLKEGDQELLGGPRIGRALQDDQLPGVKPGRGLRGGGDDQGGTWLLRVAPRPTHA